MTGGSRPYPGILIRVRIPYPYFDFELSPYQFRFRTKVSKICPYPFRIRSRVFKFNPYQSSLRTNFPEVIRTSTLPVPYSVIRTLSRSYIVDIYRGYQVKSDDFPKYKKSFENS